MPNRTIQPRLQTVDNFNVHKPLVTHLKNNIPVFSFNVGDEDVLKLRIVFEAGTWYQTKKLVSRYTAEMLQYGTKKFTSEQIATLVDSHGAFMDLSADNDYVHAMVYFLPKHAATIIPLFGEILRNPEFPEQEMKPLLANGKQSLEVNFKKVDYLAGIHFKEQLFGKTHPYGIWANVSDYDLLTRGDFIEFYSDYYSPSTCKIVLAGKVSDTILSLLDDSFGSWNSLSKANTRDFEVSTSVEKFKLIEVPDVLQSSIRVGRILFPKSDPEFLPMICLNTIFGGYFGSRLMRNIREEKGYTYGIGSGLIAFKNAGFLSIFSEVKAEAREQVMDEIFNEMKILHNEPVGTEEMETVKNYMLGSFLRSIDGPFAIEERFINSFESGIEFSDYVNKYIQTINQIDSEKLMGLACKYLNPENMTTVVAGK